MSSGPPIQKPSSLRVFFCIGPNISHNSPSWYAVLQKKTENCEENVLATLKESLFLRVFEV